MEGRKGWENADPKHNIGSWKRYNANLDVSVRISINGRGVSKGKRKNL